MIDLRSDLLVRPDESMHAAGARAAQESLYFGLREDPWQAKLEARVAALLGMEDALIFPTCTMANTTALMLLGGRPGSAVLTQPGAHVLLSEAGAGAALAGLMLSAVSAEASPAMPPLSAWNKALSTRGDVQRPAPGLCVIENTHNRAGGVALPPAYLKRFVDLARSHGAALHCDGSRLLYAAVALGVVPAALVRGFDTVSISLNKTLGAPVAALLAGSRRLIESALLVRQQLGGGMRPVGSICAASYAGLDQWHLLADVMSLARRLGAGISSFEGLVVEAPSEITNLVVVRIATPARTDIVLQRLDAAGLRALQLDAQRIRFALYRGITPQQVERAIAIIGDALARP